MNRQNSLSRAAGLAAALTLGLALNSSAGLLYVTDGLAVYSYTDAGVRSTFSNQAGSTVLGMAFDANGNLYAAARDNNAIYEYSPGGVRSTFATVNSPY